MLLVVFAFLLLVFATIPAAMFCSNLTRFNRAPSANLNGDSLPVFEPVSVLIPARNEELGIRAALDAILANKYPPFEVIVLDDASTDATATIVREITQCDDRLRSVRSQALPTNWNGKQFACWQLAQCAKFEWLLFLDADVRLGGDAIARICAAAVSAEANLLSGFPHQETLTWSEKTLIPLMHFILLGYLPIARMRACRRPEYSAGCGQLFMARRSAYFECGGHQAIQASRHDGIALPRAFRIGGFATDIFDASDVATCRMYRSVGEVTRGLLKNATEGIANPKTIVPLTLLLLGGSVLPVVAFSLSWLVDWPNWSKAIFGLATCLSYLPRVLAAIRFRQSWLGAVLHPLGVAWFVALQWVALFKHLFGKPVAWRGRL